MLNNERAQKGCNILVMKIIRATPGICTVRGYKKTDGVQERAAKIVSEMKLIVKLSVQDIVDILETDRLLARKPARRYRLTNNNSLGSCNGHSCGQERHFNDVKWSIYEGQVKRTYDKQE